ncbi:MAG: DUF2207 domain-containing protein, partial [Actinomycetia bacterium]|nr:DUF2207 domain-containing protein [Actinomycetes bacterium]
MLQKQLTLPPKSASSMHTRRVARLILVLATLVGLLLPGTAALAKSYWINEADVSIVVRDDGSLLVTELITFDFSGDFTGAFRDIPLRRGESIESVTVSDDTGAYALGGCTQLGCSSPAGTYGVVSNGDDVRVVWHHDSRDERRTFELSYTMLGVATAYDDVLDVNMQVWGDEWPVGVDRITAEVIIPGQPEQGTVYVWGHPYDIDGETSLGDDGISPSLEADNVPSERWVEIRTAFPIDLLTSTSGATVVAGDGLQQILDEETAFAQSTEAATRNAGIGLVIGLVLLLGISVGVGLFAYLRYGKEPKVDYDREYEQEPPTDLTPAEVGALLSQGAVGEKEFTATLFDLIGKGAIDAQPTQVVKSTWGGLRTETVTDLELSLGTTATGLRDFEQSVMTVVKRVLDEGPQPLTEFRDRIRDDARLNSKTYDSFQSNVLNAIVRGKLLDTRGTAFGVMLVVSIAVVIGITWFLLPRLVGNQPGGPALAIMILGGMILGTLLLAA